jgi:acetyltransferase
MIVRPKAQELILGLAEDPQFGPVVLFGHGGTAAEAIDDKALALPPLNLTLARALMRRTRVHRLLKGFRDRPAADLDAIAGALVRLSWLAADFPEVTELDINPLLADADGVIALDARVVVRAAAGGDPTARFAIRPYPVELEAVIEHREQRYLVRPIRPEDEPVLISAFDQMKPEDIRMRFFGAIKQMSHALAARLTQIDYDREMALVLIDPPGEGNGTYGIVRLSADPDFETAEFAVTVMSGAGGKGYGHLLLERILGYARSRGIGLVYGDALAENQRMIALARSLGFTVRMIPEDTGIVRLELKLDGPGV